MNRVLLRYLNDCYREFEPYYYENENDNNFLNNINYKYDLDTIYYGDLYRESYMQQIYSLRYTYAYGYEYKEMFGRLLDNCSWLKVINALSVGCGNGIDYWALRAACQQRNRSVYVKYTGLDAIEWDENIRFGKGYLESRNDVSYPNPGEAVEYFMNNDNFPYNVIVFPKSISEFGDDDFAQICWRLREISFKYRSSDGEWQPIKKVYILISLRFNADTVDAVEGLNDYRRSECLKDAMEENGYEFRDISLDYTRPDDANGRISEDTSYISYPGEIMKFFMKNKKITRSPIISKKYICNRIMEFNLRV